MEIFTTYNLNEILPADVFGGAMIPSRSAPVDC